MYEPDTDYEVGQDNVKHFGLDFHHPVFMISAVTIILFVILSLVFKAEASELFKWLRPAITTTFDWFFLSSANIFVIFCFCLAASPLGKIRLGGQDAKPDFKYLSWFAMLFAAGMGIGLMFFGVSEPISHFSSSIAGSDWAPLSGALGDPEAAKNLAMAATIYHWGIHPWAIYATVALSLAFFAYNYKLPLTFRSAFYPLLGDRIWGWPGHCIDILAVFATLFGLATSLGFGTKQALGGFNFLYEWGNGQVAIVVFIAVVTGAATYSVVKGLDGGIRVISEINMVLALILMVFIFSFGPTADIISTLFSGTVQYVKEFIPLSMPFGREDVNFSQGWTSFYWAWWISWSPFVGMFIARISRGRTVREFVVSVILVPTFLSIIWMSVFGGAAISQVIADAAAPVANVAQELKLFEMVKAFPFTSLIQFVGVVLVIVFFITSSDSGSLVVDTITAGGKEKVPLPQQIFWCAFEGVIAIVLILVGGDQALSALQAMVVSTGLPFTFLLLGMCLSLFIGLRKTYKLLKEHDKI